MNQENQESFINYKSADIYFIFSFVFDFLKEKSYQDIVMRLKKINKTLEQVGEEIWHIEGEGTPPDREGRPPMLVIKRKYDEKLEGEDIKTEGGQEGRRKEKYVPVAVYKKLISDEKVNLTYKELKLKEYQRPEPFKAKLSAYIRLGDNGAGCITFKVSISENDKQTVTLRKIDHILSLSQRQYQQGQGISTLRFTKESKFVNYISEFEDREKKGICEKYSISSDDPHPQPLLFQVFAAGLESIEQEINHPNGATDPEEIVEIQDKILMDFEDKNLVAQNPYVLSVIEVKEDKDRPMFWEDGDERRNKVPAQQSILERIPNWIGRLINRKSHASQQEQNASQQEMKRNAYKEVSSILLRMFYPDRRLRHQLRETIKDIRIPYELRSSGGALLKNYAWDSNILMCFSRVSSLFACRAGTKDQIPASFLRQTLLDSLEILRARWHMSILINALLDQEITMMKPTQPSSNNLKLLRKLIDRRRQFAYFLDDPLPYHYEGSSVTQIIAKAEEEMWLSKLRSMTFEKLEVLDKLYQDQMEYIRISRAPDFLKRVEELTKELKS